MKTYIDPTVTVDCTCAMTESSFRSCPAHGEKGYLEYEARHGGDVAFEVPVGDFIVSGRYNGLNNITVHRGDDVVRTLTVPGYKIWNVAAHCPEWLDELETIYAAQAVTR